MAVPIQLSPPPARSRGLLLQAASRIPDSAYPAGLGARWPLDGVVWNVADFTLPTAEESGCDAQYDKQPDDFAGQADQPAFVLWRSIQCSGLSGIRDLLAANINYSLDDLRSAAFAAELETGAASGGASLTNLPLADVSATASSLAASIAFLETFLAGALNGARGTIHLTPALLTLGVAKGLFKWRDDRYETPTGHIVVGDAGHSGRVAPVGQAAAGDGESWIYATSTVWFDETAIVSMESSYDGGSQYAFTRNVDRPLSERYGIVLFDPDVLAAALVDVGASASGGGGGGGGGGDDDNDLELE